jgi:hypothetical protein
VRSDLPTGTVTFLFTDVEGSTKLLREARAVSHRQQSDTRRAGPDRLTASDGVGMATYFVSRGLMGELESPKRSPARRFGHVVGTPPGTLPGKAATVVALGR